MAQIAHDNDCGWNFGHDCTCGADKAVIATPTPDQSTRIAELEAGVERLKGRCEGVKKIADDLHGENDSLASRLVKAEADRDRLREAVNEARECLEGITRSTPEAARFIARQGLEALAAIEGKDS